MSETTSSQSGAVPLSIGEQLKNLPGMAEVEECIRSKFASEAKMLREIPEYLLSLGGKRIRPALCLLTARLCGISSITEELISVASGIELIHMGTLLHDDIIDRSPLRRGKPSPHIAFGESNTLLAGDFLWVRAFSLCGKLDNFIVQETEEACVKLTEGEILEAPLGKVPCTREESLNIAEKKTAALFGLATVTGAHLADVPIEVEEHLKQFGLQIGIAFQILDDVLDVIADEDFLGKRCGGDLRERKPSIINVLWLETQEDLAKEILLAEEPANDSVVEQALALFREENNSVVETARNMAEEKMEHAKTSLENAISILKQNGRPPQPDAEELLQHLLTFTLKRLR